MYLLAARLSLARLICVTWDLKGWRGGRGDDDDVAMRYFSVAFVNGVIKEISVRIMETFT